MRVLVTGANGYIGGQLCRYLHLQGHQITLVSRKFSSEAKRLLSGSHFVEADILDKTFPDVRSPADALIHLAASNDIISKSARTGIDLSVAGTRNALQFAVNNQVGTFIFFSTLQVYGTELEGTYDETSQVLPASDYALDHLCAEHYVEMFARKYKLSCATVRPSNVYGRMLANSTDRWTLVPSCFCKEAVEKGQIVLKSSGNQVRNFISLGHLSSAIERILRTLDTRHEVINLTSSQYYRIIDIARKVQETYEKLTGNSVALRVLSDLPRSSNRFSISRDKMTRYCDLEVNETEMDEEIHKILASLIPAHAPGMPALARRPPPDPPAA